MSPSVKGRISKIVARMSGIYVRFFLRFGCTRFDRIDCHLRIRVINRRDRWHLPESANVMDQRSKCSDLPAAANLFACRHTDAYHGVDQLRAGEKPLNFQENSSGKNSWLARPC